MSTRFFKENQILVFITVYNLVRDIIMYFYVEMSSKIKIEPGSVSSQIKHESFNEWGR